MRGRKRHRKKVLRGMLAHMRRDKVAFWDWYAKAHGLPRPNKWQISMLTHPATYGRSPLRPLARLRGATLGVPGEWNDG